LKKNWIMMLCVMIVIIGILLFGYSQNRLDNTPVPSSVNVLDNFTSKQASSQENSEIPSPSSRTTTYTVKEYEGHIGVFHNDDRTPYQEIDVDVSSLPVADRELLKDGIKVSDANKLNSIIEDYES